MKNELTRLVLASALAMPLVSSAVIRTNTLLTTATDWTQSSSYSDTSFVPGAGDVVLVPDGGSYTVRTDSASFTDVVNVLSRIVFLGTTSQLTIETVGASDDTLFKPEIRSEWGTTLGLFVKDGLGRLTLGDGDKYDVNVDWSYHRMPIRVKQGTLRLAQGIRDSASRSEYLDAMTVDEGATLVLNGGNMLYTSLASLSGKGTIEPGGFNNTGKECQLRITGTSSADKAAPSFEGVLSGKINLWVSGFPKLTGTNSTFSSGTGAVRRRFPTV